MGADIYPSSGPAPHPFPQTYRFDAVAFTKTTNLRSSPTSPLPM